MAELFPNGNDRVCLKMFLKFGRLVVNSHVQRFLQLNPVENPLTREMANDVFVSVADRLKRLANLESEIGNCRKYCEDGLRDSKKSNQGDSVCVIYACNGVRYLASENNVLV